MKRSNAGLFVAIAFILTPLALLAARVVLALRGLPLSGSPRWGRSVGDLVVEYSWHIVPIVVGYVLGYYAWYLFLRGGKTSARWSVSTTYFAGAAIVAVGFLIGIVFDAGHWLTSTGRNAESLLMPSIFIVLIVCASATLGHVLAFLAIQGIAFSYRPGMELKAVLPAESPARTGHRIIHFLVDFFAATAIGVVLMFAVTWLAPRSWVSRQFLTDNVVIGYVLTFAMFGIYYVLLEGLLSTTVGKIVTGMRVVNRFGDPIGLRVAIARTICRMIPLELVSFLRSDAWGIHDAVAGTYVVRVPEEKRSREAEEPPTPKSEPRASDPW